MSYRIRMHHYIYGLYDGYSSLTPALADILAATHTCKQSIITFKVVVLWLHNQHYYTHEIKITYRDLPYYEGVRAKTHHEYKLHENKPRKSCKSFTYVPLKNAPLLGPTLSYLVVLNVVLIHHSIACTAIYSSPPLPKFFNFTAMPLYIDLLIMPLWDQLDLSTFRYKPSSKPRGRGSAPPTLP